MKLIKADQEKFVFHVAKREKPLLFGVLKLYPIVPPAHHRASKGLPANNAKEMQRLLDEALAEQRAANKKQIASFMNDPARFAPTDTGFRLTLPAADFEWLLQVLNDIRVGSWILLGCPDEGSRNLELNTKTARHLWAMEMSGLFQMNLLAAVERRH